MAAKALESSKGRQNFQRVSRLLIIGATTVGRETFDDIHPPDSLDAVLADPVREAILRTAKMTRPQWNKVYPSPGKYGKAKDWDLTLTYKMLRSICGLTPPATGWDDLPPDSDVSKEADLVRLKYYRNSIYGHVDERMGLKDEEFHKLWKDISEAIIRLAGHLSSAKKKEWENAIEAFLTAPLTSDDMLNVEELKDWYRQDVETREELIELKGEVSEIKELIRQMSPARERDLDPTTDTCSLPHHEEQLLEWFCEECRECVCRTCVTLHHRTHPRINMNNPTHMQTVTQELLEMSEKVKCEIEKYQKLIGKIRKNGTVRNDKLDKMKHKVKLVIGGWIEQLHVQQEKFVKDIETTQKLYQENDDSQVSEIERHVEDMETFRKYTEKLASDESAMSKVTQKEHAVKCNNELSSMDLKSEPKTIAGCHFIHNRNLFRKIEDLGTVFLWDCVVQGDGLKRATVGVTSIFTISTITVRGTSRPTLYNPTIAVNVKIQSDYGDVSPIIHDNRDGTYNVAYIPFHPGDHKISVIADNQEIPNGTHIVKATQCTLIGDRLRSGIVGLENRFVISLHGPAAEKIYDPGTLVKAKILSPQGNISLSILDNQDGTYTASFIPTRPGHHEISTTIDDQELPDCKYIINVNQCILTGDCLTKGTIGLKSQFIVTFPAFRGQGGNKVHDPTRKLNANIQSPEGTVTPIVHDNKDGTYLISFFPVHSGEHQVSITMQNKLSEHDNNEEVNVLQQEIPGSPFIMTVIPREFRPVSMFGRKGNKEGEFDCPCGVAVNNNDEIIVADCYNHRIQVFTCKGDHVRTIGRKGTGAGQFDKPSGITLDNDDNVIVLDKGNGRLQVVSKTGQFLRSFGSKGRDNGQLEGPWGLSLDSDSNIIVTDSGNNRVQLFSNEGKWLKSFDCGDGPRNCVSHADRYYVSSASEHCIKVFDKSGKFVCKYGTRGSSLGAFSLPVGLSVTKTAHLVICDYWNDRIQVLEMDGTFVGSFGAEGEGLGQFRRPSSVAVLGDGKLVVCDTGNYRIQIFE